MPYKITCNKTVRDNLFNHEQLRRRLLDCSEICYAGACAVKIHFMTAYGVDSIICERANTACRWSRWKL